jgi:hypothetical protein
MVHKYKCAGVHVIGAQRSGGFLGRHFFGFLRLRLYRLFGRDLTQFNSGSADLVACLRYASAYAAAFSLPCSILSTGSNGAIQYLALTL